MHVTTTQIICRTQQPRPPEIDISKMRLQSTSSVPSVRTQLTLYFPLALVSEVATDTITPKICCFKHYLHHFISLHVKERIIVTISDAICTQQA